jgi:hypothetical protein
MWRLVGNRMTGDSGGRGGGVILGGDTAKEPLDGKGRTDRHPAQKDAALFHSPLGGCEALGLRPWDGAVGALGVRAVVFEPSCCPPASIFGALP